MQTINGMQEMSDLAYRAFQTHKSESLSYDSKA